MTYLEEASYAFRFCSAHVLPKLSAHVSVVAGNPDIAENGNAHNSPAAGAKRPPSGPRVLSIEYMDAAKVPESDKLLWAKLLQLCGLTGDLKAILAQFRVEPDATSGAAESEAEASEEEEEDDLFADDDKKGKTKKKSTKKKARFAAKGAKRLKLVSGAASSSSSSVVVDEDVPPEDVPKELLRAIFRLFLPPYASAAVPQRLADSDVALLLLDEPALAREWLVALLETLCNDNLEEQPKKKAAPKKKRAKKEPPDKPAGIGGAEPALASTVVSLLAESEELSSDREILGRIADGIIATHASTTVRKTFGFILKNLRSETLSNFFDLLRDRAAHETEDGTFDESVFAVVYEAYRLLAEERHKQAPLARLVAGLLKSPDTAVSQTASVRFCMLEVAARLLAQGLGDAENVLEDAFLARFSDPNPVVRARAVSLCEVLATSPSSTAGVEIHIEKKMGSVALTLLHGRLETHVTDRAEEVRVEALRVCSRLALDHAQTVPETLLGRIVGRLVDKHGPVRALALEFLVKYLQRGRKLPEQCADKFPVTALALYGSLFSAPLGGAAANVRQQKASEMENDVKTEKANVEGVLLAIERALPSFQKGLVAVRNDDAHSNALLIYAHRKRRVLEELREAFTESSAKAAAKKQEAASSSAKMEEPPEKILPDAVFALISQLQPATRKFLRDVLAGQTIWGGGNPPPPAELAQKYGELMPLLNVVEMARSAEQFGRAVCEEEVTKGSKTPKAMKNADVRAFCQLCGAPKNPKTGSGSSSSSSSSSAAAQDEPHGCTTCGTMFEQPAALWWKNDLDFAELVLSKIAPKTLGREADAALDELLPTKGNRQRTASLLRAFGRVGKFHSLQLGSSLSSSSTGSKSRNKSPSSAANQALLPASARLKEATVARLLTVMKTQPQLVTKLLKLVQGLAPKELFRGALHTVIQYVTTTPASSSTEKADLHSGAASGTKMKQKAPQEDDAIFGEDDEGPKSARRRQTRKGESNPPDPQQLLEQRLWLAAGCVKFLRRHAVVFPRETYVKYRKNWDELLAEADALAPPDTGKNSGTIAAQPGISTETALVPLDVDAAGGGGRTAAASSSSSTDLVFVSPPPNPRGHGGARAKDATGRTASKTKTSTKLADARLSLLAQLGNAARVCAALKACAKHESGPHDKTHQLQARRHLHATLQCFYSVCLGESTALAGGVLRLNEVQHQTTKAIDQAVALNNRQSSKRDEALVDAQASELMERAACFLLQQARANVRDSAFFEPELLWLISKKTVRKETSMHHAVCIILMVSLFLASSRSQSPQDRDLLKRRAGQTLCRCALIYPNKDERARWLSKVCCKLLYLYIKVCIPSIYG